MIVDWILRCYPRSWRVRYEEELRDIVASERLSPGLIFDLLSGALDARLHPNLVSSQGDVVLKPAPAGGLPLLSGKYPERRSAGQIVLGVLAWLGWTALAWQAITALFYVLALAGLLPYPLQDLSVSGAWNGLLWLQLVAGLLLGHVVFRRLAHSGVHWQHGPRTVRAWVFMMALGTISYSTFFRLLWLLDVRPE